MRARIPIVTAVLLSGWGVAFAADSEGVFYFEKNIRPVLVKHCYKCHSAEAKKLKGGLRLDTRAGVRKGGSSGDAIIPGNADDSLLIQALRHVKDAPEMPPKKQLPVEVVNAFAAWVNMGAPDPRTDTPATPRAAELWSLQPLRETLLPKVKDAKWPRDFLDNFILAKLETAGLQPMPDADPRTLIRRAHLDLTGLPPTPEEITAFIQAAKTNRQSAFEKLIDRLLASLQFGPRWGRHWLDVARYGESAGYSRNMTYPLAWRYRNYVIRAFNADKPFDQFVREQVAGDLLPFKTPAQRDEQVMATAFLTIGAKTLNEGNIEQFNYNVADDQIDATSRAFLAMTTACARCHDHKYDPIPTRDYYAMAGIFLSSKNLAGVATNVRNEHVGVFPLGPDGEKVVAEREALQKKWSARQKVYLGFIKQRGDLKKKIAAAKGDAKAKLEEELKPVLVKVGKLNKEVSALNRSIPELPPSAMAVVDGNATDSPVLLRGDRGSKGKVAPRGMLGSLGVPARKIGAKESGRLQLAEWIVDKRNPLTARVMVNRVWLHLFGHGLVDTPDNFGALGAKPTHPELLDDLALRFMAEGWSVKKLIRIIMLSRTYQLASTHHAANHAKDPGARLYWRMNPRRLDAEALRDGMLFVSGKLDDTMLEGSQIEDLGKSKIPRQREIGRRDFIIGDIKYDVPRRSIYLPLMRSSLPEVLSLFDLPDPNLVTGRRKVTTVPAQGMFLLNSPFVLAQSKHAAERLLAVKGLDEAARVRRAFQMTLGRSPTEGEARAMRGYLRKTETEKIGWTRVFQTLFCTGEFRTVY